MSFCVGERMYRLGVAPQATCSKSSGTKKCGLCNIIVAAACSLTCVMASLSALYVTVAVRGAYEPEALGVRKYSMRTVAPGVSFCHEPDVTPPLSSKSDRGHSAPVRTMSVAALWETHTLIRMRSKR